MNNHINPRLADLAREAFDPHITPTGSTRLQTLLESPIDLRDVLVGHVAFAGHTPPAAVDAVVATIDDLFNWLGANSILQLNSNGWATFIGASSYTRALSAQIVHQLLDLLGTPCLVPAPLPDERVVIDRLLPATGTKRFARGGKPTRALSDLEAAVLHYAVLPVAKGTIVTGGKHREPRRNEYVTAAVVGGAQSLLTPAHLAGVTHDALSINANDQYTIPDTRDTPYATAPLALDRWATDRFRELLRRDPPLRTEIPRPLLYGGLDHSESLSATNTITGHITHALQRCGLSRAGLSSTSLRMWGACTALDNGATPVEVARKLGVLTNKRPDPAKLGRLLHTQPDTDNASGEEHGT